MTIDAHFIIHLFHILIVGPLFLYVGIKGATITPILFPILLVLGAFIMVYHCYLAYKKYTQGISAWVNYIHMLIIGPLLVYIGFHKENTSRKFFELLIMFGMAAIGYHGYYLIV
jgi:hypothetical protein